MKWIKNRKTFLNEAKIRDLILPVQSKVVSNRWGEKYLDYEEVSVTDKIKQGKWKLDNEDKMKVLGSFFQCNMSIVFEEFGALPDKLNEIIKQSIDYDLYDSDNKEKFESILKDFDAKTPTIDQMVLMVNNSVFRKLSVNETNASEMIQKDENGRPVMIDGEMVKITKEVGEPVFTKNLTNINSFISDYNKCYPNEQSDTLKSNDINRLISSASEHFNDYKSDFEIFNKDIYLSISHNPKDILNMSISKFYSSCQHLYSSSGYNERLLSNVFDPNSIPAFLIFETPLYNNDNVLISEFLPLSRMFIRSIETEDGQEDNLFFDRAYPDRVKGTIGEMVEKYSDNIEVGDPSTYLYYPDIDTGDELTEPYMDRLGIKQKTYIGNNIKTLLLSRNINWSDIKISPNAKIKEIVIETENIPEDIFKYSLNLEWVKFKMMKINNLEKFSKLKTDSIIFDKCKFDGNILTEISDVKRLKLISCDVTGINISSLKGLEELHLIYTLDSIDEVKEIIKDMNINKLVLSGDLITKESKEYINSLKRNIKIEVVGPVIN